MIRVGDTIEVLEPEDKANYPFIWHNDMDNNIGNLAKVIRVFLGHKGLVSYLLDNNEWTWHESNLKLIKRNSDSTITVGETVVVTSGKHEGEISTVIEQYESLGEIYQDLQNRILHIPDDCLRPVNHTITLF